MTPPFRAESLQKQELSNGLGPKTARASHSSISDLEAQGSNLIPAATLGVQATLWFDVLSDAARVRNADRKVLGGRDTDMGLLTVDRNDLDLDA